jgi:hypothetical protein
MSASLQLWPILYKRLVPHILAICLILLLAVYAILGVYALEQRASDKLQERLSELPIFVLYSSEGKDDVIIYSVQNNLLVDRVIAVSAQETLQRVEQEFDLSGLSHWVKPETITDYLIIYLDRENYSSTRFQDFYAYLTSQHSITDVYYSEKELERWSAINSFFNKYRLIPIIFILLISGILIFLTRRLMRVRQIRCWEDWKRKGIPQLYKFSHLLIEIGLVVIILVIGVGIPCFIWQDAFLPIISSMHYGWYGVFALLVLYFIISSLNLIGYGKKS